MKVYSILDISCVFQFQENNKPHSCLECVSIGLRENSQGSEPVNKGLIAANGWSCR